MSPLVAWGVPVGADSDKLVLDVENALRWAYQRALLHHDGLFGLKLPSLASPGWIKMIDTGTVVDESHEPRFPVGAGTPHPDALALDYAVRALPDVRVDWRKQRAFLMGDLSSWLSDDDCIVAAMATGPVVDVYEGRDRRGNAYAHARVRKQAEAFSTSNVREMVMMHARLGNRPIWHLGEPRVERCRPVMVGRQTGKNLYTAGSHCPLQLVPPAQEIACARWEYSIWRDALVTLSNVRLASIKLLPPAAGARPWIDGETEQEMTRVLPGKGPRRLDEKLPLKPSRAVALPPIMSEIEETAEHYRRRSHAKLLTKADEDA